MMVNDAELDTAPALDDWITLHMVNSAGAEASGAYRIEDGPLPGDGGWFIVLADEDSPGGKDWAAAIKDTDIKRITRLIESGVMQWDYQPQDTTSEQAVTTEEATAERGLTDSGMVLLPRATGRDDLGDAGANDDDH
ncbi:DUF6211 family protein [Streptomyces sp. MJM1172]|uniref:DUF6211 family protein n=1 Tax=Streptomyces sp. MJM1172 TaxID=1703926 RepID=UPI00093D0C9A|nr:DUF6211 family protein [Streptomyces sp. MJM1172]OKI50359.1 hypothetical protein AMK15_32955 [Streptomyces sp. MJM1172]